MHLLIDFLNPQGTIAITEQIHKIKINLDRFEVLKQAVQEQKAKNKTGVTCITVFGRWIVMYVSNLTNDKDTQLYFIDFKVDMNDFIKNKIFSFSQVRSIQQIQERYEKVYTSKLDTGYLTFAEPFETVVLPNLFGCTEDSIVVKTADRLGVLPMIQTSVKVEKGLRVALVEDKVTLDKRSAVHVYAFFNFIGPTEQGNPDEGYAYIKLFDLFRNMDKVDPFLKAVQEIGGKFDRAFFMERFAPGYLN